MKKLSLILAAGFFLMAQTTQGEWAILNSVSVPQDLKLQTLAEPALLPSVVNAALFPQQVESKEIWVGNTTLSFHVTARESLQTTATTPSAIRELASKIWNEVKQPLLYSLLDAVTRETKTEPLRRNFGAARLLARSA